MKLSVKIFNGFINFRPRYTKEVAECVLKFHKNQQTSTLSPNEMNLVLDVGCGSGQSSALFHLYSKKILGIDIDTKQIQQAKLQNKHENIVFMQGAAERLPVDDNSVDLITAGASAHWFDLPKFFEEAKRVLKQNGCLSLFCYGFPEISPLNMIESTTQNPTQMLENAVLNTSSNEKNSRRQEIKHRYQNVFAAMPFDIKTRKDDILLSFDASFNDLTGFLRSTGHYKSYMDSISHELRANGEEISQEKLDARDYVVKLQRDLNSLWKLGDTSTNCIVMKITFHLFILLAKV